MPVSEETLESAEQIVGHRFSDRSLLAIALTHASFADSRLESNERMEFLGDAVLGMLVCEHLYRSFPDLLEGEMTKIKSAVVSRRLCAKITTGLGLDRLVVIGKGMQTRSNLPSSLSAAVFEAIIGAIYLDAGLGAVERFVMPLLERHIDVAAKSGHQQNFKSVLQQHAQQRWEATAEYVLLDEKGPDHAKCFEVCAEIDGRRYPSCWAPSKKQAEQLAALAALEKLSLVHRDDQGHLVYAPPQEAPASDAADEAPGEAPDEAPDEAEVDATA